MRLVALSTALALSFAAISVCTPASAAPDKKDQVAKTVKAQVAKTHVAKKSVAAKPSKLAKVHVKKVVHSKKLASPKQARRVKTEPVTQTVRIKRHRVASINVTSVATDAMPQYGDTRLETRDPNLYYVRPAETRRPIRTASVSSPAKMRIPALFASPDPVMEARRWIGTNPTDRNTLWCARFMNFVLERSGYSGTGSDAARSFASYGHRISTPQVGAIAVLTRGKNGGHVGIISGIDPSGNPIIISGNHGKKVGEGVYSRSRVIAYVMPN